jgi:hypothetical protein
MANWKKIIVSGSDAHLAAITSSVLTDNNILVAGTGGALESSGITYDGSTLGVGSSIITSTGATSILSGSFSGSFKGDGSLLTGLATKLDISGSTGNTDIDLKTEDFTIASGNSVSTAVTSNTVTIAVVDSGITATQLATSVTGTGLSGGAGTAFSVDYGSTAGTAVQGSTTISISGTSGEIGVTGTTAQALGGGPAYTLTLPDTISGNRTFSNNLTVTGNLIVNGATTTVSTANLEVEDRFIFLNDGGGGASTEGGIIVESGTADSGSAFFFDGTTSRWALADDIKKDATAVTPEAYSAAVVDVANGQSDAAKYKKNGNIKVDGSGDIFIYVE